MKPLFLTNKTKPRTKPKKARSAAKSKVKAQPSNKPKRTTNAKSKSTIPSTVKGKSKPPTKTTKRRISSTVKDTPSSKGFFSSLTQYTIIILIIIGTLLFINRDQWSINSLLHTSQPNELKPNPEKYATLTASLEANRQLLNQQYLAAYSNAEKQQIINQACVLLEDNLPKLMRCWLGHPWDFNGTATVPGEGKIACGYFVSVIMRDAGFKINRIRVAQQPSQNIIRTFVDTSHFYEIKTNTPYHQYVSHITSKDDGIHIVGLDKHVAFIVIKDQKMRFIHSGGLHRRVVDESPEEAYSLEHSNYRVISNITRNPNAIKKWILGETFPTGGTTAANR